MTKWILPQVSAWISIFCISSPLIFDEKSSLVGGFQWSPRWVKSSMMESSIPRIKGKGKGGI